MATSPDNRRFDAAIVGAGPAGAIAARELARDGASVALIDASHPREKPCGGGVTGRALALAGCELAGGRPIGSVVFEAGGRTARVKLPDERCLQVFPRATFDAALLAMAQAAGAELIAARATGVRRRSDGWSVDTGAGSIEAAWLLGADGAAGIVRRQVFRPFTREQLSVAAGAYVDGVETDEIVIAFVDEPGGYLWSFPRPGHLAVGACAQADVSTSDAMRRITNRWLDGYPPAASRSRRSYAWPIPSLSPADLRQEQPAGDRWLLLGDAAGLVDPITREGIYFAIRSGLAAAAALRRPDAAMTYATVIRSEVHDELRRAARLKAGFYRPAFTRLLVEALAGSPAIAGVMVDLIAGRQPYRGLERRLVSTLELKWLWRTVRLRRSGG